MKPTSRITLESRSTVHARPDRRRVPAAADSRVRDPRAPLVDGEAAAAEPLEESRDGRRLFAGLLSSVVPGLGQLANGRRRLAARLLVPSLIAVAIVWLIVTLVPVPRLGAWAIAPGRLTVLLGLNVVVLAWRLFAVGHAFFDRRYPAVPRRFAFIGLVVLVTATAAPHAYAWQVGSAAGAAFERIFAGGALDGSSQAAGPVPGPGPGERINILLVGIDATEKRSAILTDTMIVASVDPVGRTVSMLSIPRDLVGVPLGDGDDYGPKLNSLYSFAARDPAKYPQGGMRTLEDAIGALLDIPIHYYARFDFDGFIGMIDAVGGLEVDVARGFSDPKYDGFGLTGRGWSIEVGRHHLDGANALAYARVRRAAGESDLTRASRQQQILVAFKDRLTSGGSIFWALPRLLGAFGDAARTDIPLERLPDLALVADEMDSGAIVRAVMKEPLFASRTTRYGASQVPDIPAIRAMAARLFSAPGTPPVPWPAASGS
jgi:LCP family protein required for cell wall assembly